MTWLYIFLGGGLGSVCRYWASKASIKWVPTDFPIGTLIANVLACLALALLVVFFQAKQHQWQWIQPLFIIGFCGGFSTFSTFGNETYQLIQGGHVIMAILNILISLSAGIGLIYLIRAKA